MSNFEPAVANFYHIRFNYEPDEPTRTFNTNSGKYCVFVRFVFVRGKKIQLS